MKLTQSSFGLNTILLAASTSLSITALAPADVISAPNVADAWIAGSYRNNNYGGDTQLYVSDGTAVALNNANRALFKFDLTGVEAQVNSATLTLTTGTVNGSPPTTFKFYRGTGAGSQDWIENQVKFDIYKTGSSWSTAGGDFDTETVVTKSVSGTVTPFTVDITTLVQNAIDASQTYLTLFAFGDQNTAYNLDALSSKEVSNSAYRPALSIDSEAIPEPASAALIALGGVAMLGARRRRA